MARQQSIPVTIPITVPMPPDLANMVTLWAEAAGLTPGELCVGALRLALHMLEDTAGQLDPAALENEVAP
jgi:hypothetical protein